MQQLYLSPTTSGDTFVSDWHNALKFGYDVKNDIYPEWLLDLLRSLGYPNLQTNLLPKVRPPGTALGRINAAVIDKYGLSPRCEGVAGRK